MRLRLASFASDVLNPLLLSLVAIVLMSLGTTDSTSGALILSLVTIATGLLPVYLLALYLVKSGRMDSVFNNTRRQRRGLYLAGIVSVLAAMLVLWLMDAPTEMLATLTTVLAAGVIFLVINTWWKISIHAAFAMGVAALLTFLYGWLAVLVALPLVPLIAWSRIELGQHTLGQVIAGALLAVFIQLTVFFFFDLY